MSLASNLATRGRLKEAIPIYEGLIADFPTEQAFYQYSGIAYSYLGEYDKAISRLRQGLAIRPSAVGYFNLAVTYEKTGRLKEAAENLALYLRNPQGENEENVAKAKAELDRLTKLIGGSASR
jgi:tetratricopeptide (TPR) repeat protein